MSSKEIRFQDILDDLLNKTSPSASFQSNSQQSIQHDKFSWFSTLDDSARPKMKQPFHTTAYSTLQKSVIQEPVQRKPLSNHETKVSQRVDTELAVILLTETELEAFKLIFSQENLKRNEPQKLVITEFEVRAIYRRLAFELHPDTQSAAAEAKTTQFIRIQKAYEILKHAFKKKRAAQRTPSK